MLTVHEGDQIYLSWRAINVAKSILNYRYGWNICFYFVSYRDVIQLNIFTCVSRRDTLNYRNGRILETDRTVVLYKDI